jgi:hypothetical protein
MLPVSLVFDPLMDKVIFEKRMEYPLGTKAENNERLGLAVPSARFV